MSSLLFLDSDDFFLKNVKEDDNTTTYMCHEIKGYSLVLFYSTQCQYCQRLIPLFKTLPETIQGCHFGMINVTVNKQMLQLSHRSCTVIDRVPLMFLYLHGSPIFKYNGPYDVESIHRCIYEISEQYNSAQFVSGKQKRKVSEWSTGMAVTDECTYLEFNDAYLE